VGARGERRSGRTLTGWSWSRAIDVARARQGEEAAGSAGGRRRRARGEKGGVRGEISTHTHIV
jgi:hypothetical protein